MSQVLKRVSPNQTPVVRRECATGACTSVLARKVKRTPLRPVLYPIEYRLASQTAHTMVLGVLVPKVVAKKAY
jgi:hypothetical protein